MAINIQITDFVSVKYRLFKFTSLSKQKHCSCTMCAFSTCFKPTLVTKKLFWQKDFRLEYKTRLFPVWNISRIHDSDRKKLLVIFFNINERLTNLNPSKSQFQLGCHLHISILSLIQGHLKCKCFNTGIGNSPFIALCIHKLKLVKIVYYTTKCHVAIPLYRRIITAHQVVF